MKIEHRVGLFCEGFVIDERIAESVTGDVIVSVENISAMIWANVDERIVTEFLESILDDKVND